MSNPADRRALVGIVVGLAIWHGATAALVPWFEPSPHNDDWVYAYPVYRWLQSGQPEFHWFTGPLCIVQVAWGTLASVVAGGFTFSVLRVSALVWNLIAAVAYYGLVRWAGGTVKWAVLLVALLATNPLMHNLSWSFMTDVPFLALGLAAVACWARAIAGRGGRETQGGRAAPASNREQVAVAWFAAGTAFAALTAMERITGVILFAAPLVWAISSPRRRLRFAVQCVLVPVALVGGVTLLPSIAPSLQFMQTKTAGVADRLREFGVSQLADLGTTAALALALTGLCVLPVVVTARWFGGWRRGLVYGAVGAVVFAVFGFFYERAHPGARFPELGNYIYALGLGPVTLAEPSWVGFTRPDDPTPAWLWRGLHFVSLGAGALLLARILDAGLSRLSWGAARSDDESRTHAQAGGSSPEAARLLRAEFWVLWLGLVIVMSLTGQPYYDRYATVLLPLAALFVPLGRGPGKAQTAAIIAFALVMGWFAQAGTVDYWRWNEARWKAVAWLESQGITHRQIDGGFEYNGWRDALAPGGPSLLDPSATERGLNFWWVTDDRWRITLRPGTGKYETVKRFDFNSPLYAGVQYLYVNRKKD